MDAAYFSLRLRAETVKPGEVGSGIGAYKPQNGWKAARVGALAALMEVFNRDSVEDRGKLCRDALPGCVTARGALLKALHNRWQHCAVQDDREGLDAAVETAHGNGSAGEEGSLQQAG